MALFGILLSLALLMWLAYRGVNVIVLAPVLAMLAVLFDGQYDLVPAYTQIFMTAMGGFVIAFFPLFLLGAIFGKVMEDTGSAAAIARAIARVLGERRGIAATVLACAVLTYGGVSLFVVVFAVYPLAAAMFRAADIPKRLVPGAIALGAFTFTMTALPGTVQIQNMIPMRYFGTTAFAAPVTGTIAAAMMLGAGLWWLQRRANRARQRGEGYGEGHTCEPAAAIERLPPLWAALAPIACVLIANYVLSEHVIPRWDPAPLSRPPLGPVSLSDVRGVWATIIALILAIGVAAPLYLRTARSFNASLTQGALGSLLPVFNTASEVGYGKTIAALAGFALVKSSLLSVPGSVLASEAVAVNALAGITGSASGGLGIALEALGPTYLQRALEAGISPELLHRIASLSCGGLDTLPHNGAVITLLAICGLSHRQSYVDVAVVTVIVPVAATALIVAALSVAL